MFILKIHLSIFTHCSFYVRIELLLLFLKIWAKEVKKKERKFVCNPVTQPLREVTSRVSVSQDKNTLNIKHPVSLRRQTTQRQMTW